MNNQNIYKTFLAVVATGAALITVSCGGGGAVANPGPGPGPGPAAGTADLTGQLVHAGDVRATSAAGDGLPGVPVTLINVSTGALQGNDLTDGLGRYEFRAIPSGSSYLVKVEFNSSQDLNGDGLADEVELFFPVALADQSISSLLQPIGLSDSDSDGQLDAVEVEVRLGDDNGRSETHHSQHRHRDGRTIDDSNGNGSFDDSDRSFDDSRGNGLPDSGSGLGSAETRGLIEALGADSITVSGITFAATTATEWQVGANHHAGPGAFSVGQWVKVEGFRNAAGLLIAYEVKDSAADNSGGGSDDDSNDLPGEREIRGNIEALTPGSITIAGVTFALNSATEWQVGDNHTASPGQFSVGQWAKVEGFMVSGVLTAHEVKDSAADNGGGGSDDDDDDDEDDDNSGSGGGGSDNDDDDDSGSDGGDDD